MPDSRTARIGLVLGGLGGVIFLLAAFAITEANRWLVTWIGVGGLALALLASLVVGLVWAWRPEAIELRELSEVRMPENDVYVSSDRERGYFCISDAQGPLVQGEAVRDRREIHIMGDAPLVIDKMFGPLIFFPLRVTADIDSGEWVIERLSGEDNEWHEEARIAGQREEDFTEDHG